MPSQATTMALVCCILGKFLGVVCHCFPPRLDVPTFAARCLHVRNDARDPSSERWNYGQERSFLFTPLGIFCMHCTIYLHQMNRTWITAHCNICYCNYEKKKNCLEDMLMGHYKTKYCTDIKYVINTTCSCTFIPVYYNKSLILLLHYIL
jgi:hypothetical protein